MGTPQTGAASTPVLRHRGAYYNEIDPYAAQWCRNLIAAGHLPAGDVDERDIWDVTPADLRGYTQCHFFAGIGGWAYALRLAGWPDDRPVWTGSCPCQPFSAAGKGRGFADERHLWPVFHYLIGECRPPVCFGEQVDKAVDWLALVEADLEADGYQVGAVVAPAAGVGAPHGRHRIWWVADATGARAARHTGEEDSAGEPLGAESGSRGFMGLGYTTRPRRNARTSERPKPSQEIKRLSPAASAWLPCTWLPCRDGKSRSVEPGTFPLAHGVPARVGRLRAYGNAIVPQVAEAFIRAYLEEAS